MATKLATVLDRGAIKMMTQRLDFVFENGEATAGFEPATGCLQIREPISAKQAATRGDESGGWWNGSHTPEAGGEPNWDGIVGTATSSSGRAAQRWKARAACVQRTCPAGQRTQS